MVSISNQCIGLLKKITESVKRNFAKCNIRYLESYVTTISTKTKYLLIESVVMSTAIDGATARAFFLGAIPLATFTGAGK